MSKYIEDKKQNVVNLSGDLLNCESLLVFEFNKLDCEHITQLRKTLRELNAKIVVKKNNIIERALISSKLVKNLNLRGQNAILLSHNKEIIPLQVITKMAKDLDFVRLKVAYFDKHLFDETNIDVLSNLKSKNEMIAGLAGSLLQPIYKLLFILKNIKHE